MKRFEHLLNRNEPAVLVLETFEGDGAYRARRAQELCRTFVRLASTRKVAAAIYSRQAVAATLGLRERASRHVVAKAVRSRLSDFSHRLPPKRRPWIAEDPRRALFDAAALALAHYAAHGVPLPPVHPGAPE